MTAKSCQEPLAIFFKKCNAERVKRIIISHIFLLLFVFFVIPSFTKSYAGILPNGSPCVIDSMCSSNYCLKVPPAVAGACAPESLKNRPKEGGKNEIKKLPDPPAPPCADLKKGKCNAVKTSIGNVSTEPGQFISRIFGILLAASGGIALLLIMRSGYTLMTSRGKPETVQQGREQLVAAIVGLIFIIFSFVFLQILASDLLRIPGFR